MIPSEAWRLSALPVAVLAAACLQEPPESSRGRQKSVSPERPPEKDGTQVQTLLSSTKEPVALGQLPAGRTLSGRAALGQVKTWENRND